MKNRGGAQGWCVSVRSSCWGLVITYLSFGHRAPFNSSWLHYQGGAPGCGQHQLWPEEGPVGLRCITGSWPQMTHPTAAVLAGQQWGSGEWVWLVGPSWGRVCVCGGRYMKHQQARTSSRRLACTGLQMSGKPLEHHPTGKRKCKWDKTLSDMSLRKAKQGRWGRWSGWKVVGDRVVWRERWNTTPVHCAIVLCNDMLRKF
jgi:hypothetical protein